MESLSSHPHSHPLPRRGSLPSAERRTGREKSKQRELCHPRNGCSHAGRQAGRQAGTQAGNAAVERVLQYSAAGAWTFHTPTIPAADAIAQRIDNDCHSARPAPPRPATHPYPQAPHRPHHTGDSDLILAAVRDENNCKTSPPEVNGGQRPKQNPEKRPLVVCLVADSSWLRFKIFDKV